MKLVKHFIKEYIYIPSYREASNFIEEFEKDNYVMKNIKLTIPVAYVKVFANSLGVIAYSHDNLLKKKRRQLKIVLDKIERKYDYINEGFKPSNESFLNKIINFLRTL